MAPYHLRELLIAHLSGAEGVGRDGGGLRDAYRVGHLDLAAPRKPRGDDVLRHIPCGIGAGAVNLRGILPGEAAAAVARVAAVGVDDDLASGEAGVAHRAADYKAPRGVDEVLGLRREPLCGKDRLDDFLAYGLDKVRLLHLGRVLGREDNCVDSLDGAVIAVDEGELAFRVRPQPGKAVVLPELRLAPHEEVRVGDGGRHQHVGLIAGEAEHQSLISCSLLLRIAAVNALVDVGRLLADGREDCAGACVKAHVGADISDVPDGAPYELLDVNPCAG